MGRRVRHLNPKDFGATVALDARFVPNGVNNVGLATWPTRTGNATYDQGQSTESLRPLYISSTSRGVPCVRFDGTGDYLIGANMPSTGASLVCAFHRTGLNAQSAGAAIQGLLTTQHVNNGSGFSLRTNNDGRLTFLTGGSGNNEIIPSGNVTTNPIVAHAQNKISPSTVSRNLRLHGSGALVAVNAGNALTVGRDYFPDTSGGGRVFKGDMYAAAVLMDASESVRHRIAQSFGYSFKISM